MYRQTAPGPTFQILKEISRRMPDGAYVFTSNVDGHFQQVGFAPAHVVECHGSIHHLQCIDACMGDVWSADPFLPEIDEDSCLLLNEPPVCAWCNGIARPNILMFGDGEWIDHRTRAQLARLNAWRTKVDRLLVFEIGAGTAIPSVRIFGEDQGVPIIRINTVEAKNEAGRGVSLAIGGIEAMRGIASVLIERGFLER
jgi:NAD-dependent SIR2 family protein deacetylase